MKMVGHDCREHESRPLACDKCNPWDIRICVVCGEEV